MIGRSPPWFIACVVAVVYLNVARLSIQDPFEHDFVKVTQEFTDRGGHSEAIERQVTRGPVHRFGYDGQFYFFIALDPVGASPYLDQASYRYGRIGYPIVARAVALGREQWIRAALVLVNAVAIGAAVLFAGLLLRLWGSSAWWSLLVATYPGLMLFAFVRDTTEPLAFAVALAATWLFARSEKSLTMGAAGASGLVFAAAGLVRESALLFALSAAIACAARHRRAAALLLVTSVAPYLAWKAFLSLRVSGASAGLVDVPLRGILDVRPWSSDELLVVLAVIVPVLIWVVLATRMLRAGPSLPPLLVLTNCLLLLVLEASVYDGYGSAGRVAAGAAIAAVVCYPATRHVWGPRVAVVAVALWSLPWWIAMGSVATLLT